MTLRAAINLVVLFPLAVLTLSAQTQAPTASMTVQVKVPSNTPAGDTIWVSGDLLFDRGSTSWHVQMSRVQGTSDTWQATVSAPAGTIERYIFLRNDDWSKKEAYVPLTTKPQTFRELLVKNGATVSEAVAQWIDTPLLNNSTGTLTGRVADTAGNPLSGIWVSAGPHQTFTDASGDFIIYGVPAGACTVTLRSENGEFGAVNVTAAISPNATTVQNVQLVSATMSSVTFRVTVPANTPVGAVPRLFGDTYRLGMIEIPGEGNPDSTRLVEMTPAEGGQWSYTVQLGNGACVNYLYTLGYYQLNYENDTQGKRVTRTVCVNGPTTVGDTARAWKSPQQVAVSLTATSPTGAEDTLYVTTDVFGSLVKMWPTGPGKAAYTLYLNPNTTLNYRYIRNGDPDSGTEIVGTDRNPPAYRSLFAGPSGASRNDTIVAWRHQMHEQALTTVTSGMTGPVAPRSSGEPFQTGVEVIDYWRSNWMPLTASTMERIKSVNARWVQIPAVWGFLTSTPVSPDAISSQTTDPPKGELGAYVSFQPQDLIADIRAAKAAGLHVALTSDPYPPIFPGNHTHAWFDQFFQQVQSFSVYYAKIAQQEGVEMLILGFLHFDSDNNSDSATRIYINAKWKSVVAAVRASGYTGKLMASRLTNQPEYDWYGDLDYLGFSYWVPVATSASATVQSMYNKVIGDLTNYYLPIVNRFHKPVVFPEVSFYSARTSALQTYDVFDPRILQASPDDPSVPSDYDEQARAYQAVLLAFAATPWVQGCYSFGYEYSTFDSKGFSIRGKTAEQILSQIYKQINDNPGFNLPLITSVNTAGGTQDITQNAWIEIRGRNLATASVGPGGMTWDNVPEFASGAMPTQLGGVSVTVNGKPAFVSYVSATQVNVLTPVDSTSGPVQIVVNSGGESSVPFGVRMRTAAASFLLIGGTNYVLAAHADYSLVGPVSMSVPGYPFSPARPGETIILWGVGFGLPRNGVVNGSSSQSGLLPGNPGIQIGGVDATVTFAGVVGPGLYQFNVIVPVNAADGNDAVVWSYQQEQGQVYPIGDLIAVQRQSQ